MKLPKTVTGAQPTTDLPLEIPNPNFGRFYVAYYEPILNAAGKPVINANGFPDTKMIYFKWFDETPYVKVRDTKELKYAVAVVRKVEWPSPRCREFLLTRVLSMELLSGLWKRRPKSVLC